MEREEAEQKQEYNRTIQEEVEGEDHLSPDRNDDADIKNLIMNQRYRIEELENENFELKSQVENYKYQIGLLEARISELGDGEGNQSSAYQEEVEKFGEELKSLKKKLGITQKKNRKLNSELKKEKELRNKDNLELEASRVEFTNLQKRIQVLILENERLQNE